MAHPNITHGGRRATRDRPLSFGPAAAYDRGAQSLSNRDQRGGTARRQTARGGSRRGCRICRVTTRSVHFRGCCPHCGREYGLQRELSLADRMSDVRQWVRDWVSIALPRLGPSALVIGHAAIVITIGVIVVGSWMFK